MLEFVYPFLLLSLIIPTECAKDPLVVGGEEANIEQFPHSAFLRCNCFAYWICGASIVTNKVLLTAAHCVAKCDPTSSTISVSVGHAHRRKGVMSSVTRFFYHKHYDEATVKNDIALLRIKTPLQFNHKVKRLALMKHPPYSQVAQIAGWGLIDEQHKIAPDILQYGRVYLHKKQDCQKMLGGRNIPVGTFCTNSGSYAAGGDSGGAVVVRNYIQVGIQSYKIPGLSISLVVITDTGYFYEWIKNNARILNCN